MTTLYIKLKALMPSLNIQAIKQIEDTAAWLSEQVPRVVIINSQELMKG